MAITTELIDVTPKMAEKWLGANAENRPLRAGVVERYAADMRDNNWTQCVTPISFFEDGTLADGQHRLWAVVESGTTQKFLVMRGVQRVDAANIDRGLIRSVADNLQMAGMIEKGRVITFNMVAVAKAVDAGSNTRNAGYTQAEVLKLLRAYWNYIAWAESHGPKRRYLRNACVYAAICRAMMYEDDRDRLRRFCAIVDEGFAESPTDAAAVALRNYILENSTVIYRGVDWLDTFNRVQNAIWNFMRGNRLTVIKRTETERYPLKDAQVVAPHVAVKKASAIIAKQRNQHQVGKTKDKPKAKPVQRELALPATKT